MSRTDKGSIHINAPASRIYNAFRSSLAMESWLPPEGMKAQMLAFDFREGGFYRMRLTYLDSSHPHGKTTDDADEVEVQFIRLIENDRIEQSVVFESDQPEFSGVMKITWNFQETDSGTEVSVQFDDVPAGISKEDHAAGISASLENLARFTQQSEKATRL